MNAVDSTIGNITINNNNIISSSSAISFDDNNLITTGDISSNSGVFSGTVDVAGKLTSESADIGSLRLENKGIKIGIDSVLDFSNNKVTVGDLHSNSITTGAISGTNITASGTITAGSGSKLGDITVGQGSLTTESGLFNLGNDGIKTTGTLEISSAKLTSTLSVTDVITGESGAVLGNITISNGSISSSGTAINFGNDNLSTTGTITGAVNSKLADITFNNGSIKSTSGKIDFDNENLVTTGTFSAGNLSGSALNLSGDATVNGILIAASGSQLADFTFTNGIIKSNSGTINFDNENIKTIGSLSVSSASQIANIKFDDNEITSNTSSISLATNNLTNVGSISSNSLSTQTVTATDITASNNLTVGTTSVTGSILAALDSVTLGQSDNSKVLTQDANGSIKIGKTNEAQVIDIVSHNKTNAGLKLGGILIEVDANEINQLSGMTTTVKSELNNRFTKQEIIDGYSPIDGSSFITKLGTVSTGEISTNVTINTEKPITTNKKVTANSLDVNELVIYDNVIGHSTDIDLMTLESGKVTISGDLESSNLKTASITLGTKLINANADEINILDGLQSSTQELNLLNGSSAGTKVNNKAVIYSNNGSISATNVTASGNVNATGAIVADLTLGVGSIESASGQINVGSNNVVTTGDITANNVLTGTLTVADGSIQDSEGSITFGTTNLSTSGNITKKRNQLINGLKNNNIEFICYGYIRITRRCYYN